MRRRIPMCRRTDCGIHATLHAQVAVVPLRSSWPGCPSRSDCVSGISGIFPPGVTPLQDRHCTPPAPAPVPVITIEHLAADIEHRRRCYLQDRTDHGRLRSTCVARHQLHQILAPLCSTWRRACRPIPAGSSHEQAWGLRSHAGWLRAHVVRSDSLSKRLTVSPLRLLQH